MKYITKGEPNLGSLDYKVDLTDDIVSVLERTPTAGDYVLYDKINQELICISSSADLSNYPISNYIPIGLVVVPTKHNVYSDGSCGIVSLMEMSSDTPDEGKPRRLTLYFGNNNTNTLLPNLLSVPTGNTLNGIPTGYYSKGILPTDNDFDIQCAHDVNSHYFSSSYDHIPSPYLTNGSRNPGYYQTTPPSSSSNTLADFDGIGNSIILQNSATAQSDWKTADTIINDPSSGYAPAACCCWRFHTEGTSQGDWYLPACGELGYISARIRKINRSVYNLQQEYYSGYAGQTIDGDLVSSTESSARYFWTVYGDLGIVSKSFKNDANTHVRAFLRAGGTSKISLKVI